MEADEIQVRSREGPGAGAYFVYFAEITVDVAGKNRVLVIMTEVD